MLARERFLAGIINDIEHNRLALPTLPEVALRVRDAVEDENATAQQIAGIVATDAALSARLLRVVNSPLYRGRTPVDNLQTAVSRLGNQRVRDLVTSLVMRQIFQATTDVLDQRLRRLWAHSVQVAAISRALAQQLTSLSPDLAMLGGLIHDIGALPILVRAEDTPELLEDETALDETVAQLHSRVGGAILEAWGFPPALIAVAAEHEDLLRQPGSDPDCVDLVMVANLQCYVGTEHPHGKIDWSKVSAFDRLGIQPDVSIVELGSNEADVQALESLLMP